MGCISDGVLRGQSAQIIKLMLHIYQHMLTWQIDWKVAQKLMVSPYLSHLNLLTYLHPK